MVPPDGVECAHSSSLAADRARLSENKAKILELERSLASLNEENHLLQERLDAYTYPVLTLPNEIVSEIFLHFLPTYPETPPIIGRASPNVVGQICRTWRETAFSTPGLWRGISFSLRNGKRLAQKLHLLETWLQRSGSCLLSIIAHLGSSLAAKPFLVAITAQRVRWEHLRLHSNFPSFPSFEAPLPFLRSVYIEPVPKPANNTSLPLTLCAAPSLRVVAVLCPYKSFITLYPWSQLTTFIGHEILPQQCVRVLQEAPNLVYCKVEVDEVAHQAPFSRDVTLPYLSTFILDGSPTSSSAWIILDALALPALVTLQISEYRHSGRDPVARLKSLISRSNCNIRTLSITRSKEPVSFLLGLPTVGEILFNVELPWVNPFVEPEDEELELEESSGDDDAGTGSDSAEETDDSEA
ncbi:hypothetical protein C8R46DRAFT_1329189 [Mycena filopes]|nr:hypothetical protein C8R46DRAFT_1329189 [Mycena filopes]